MNSISNYDSDNNNKHTIRENYKNNDNSDFVVTPTVEIKCTKIQLGFLQKQLIKECMSIMKNYLTTPRRRLKAILIKTILTWEKEESKSIKAFCKMRPQERIKQFERLLSIFEEILLINNEIHDYNNYQKALTEVYSLYQDNFVSR